MTGTVSGTPAAELAVTAELVRELLATQQPDLAELELRAVASGWDNVTYRLGDRLAVRLPRRAVAAELLLHERHVLPLLAPRLPVQVPVPVRHGAPSDRYPWYWHVVPWLEGDVGGADPLPTDAAAQLGRVLAALHQPAPADAPVNPVRGVPLHDRAEAFERRVTALDGRGVATDVLRSVFAAGSAVAPPTDRVWLHGDLHPRNLLLREGRLAAVLDWGDTTAGDPATDLAVAWLACDAAGRVALRAQAGPRDPADWARAAGWAAHLAAALLDAGLIDDPAFAAIGARTVNELATDQEIPA